MSRVHKLRTVATMLMPVSLLAFAVSVSMATAVGADTTSPCAYIGYAFVDDQAVPAGTGIRVLEDSMVLEDTTTGLEELGDNQFYLPSVIAEVGTEVNFEIWFDGEDGWLPADETAIHEESGRRVEVDLHAWSGTPVTPSATPTTAPTAAPTASPTNDATPTPTLGGGGLGGGAVAGIVIGSLIALGLVMWVMIRRRKKSKI
ncbi:MAG TPA: hypothetical protein VMX96_04245 [Dehalococcoidia bacterium]|nr:hypothetical protein [Dehalococcoidia bacterium]